MRRPTIADLTAEIAVLKFERDLVQGELAKVEQAAEASKAPMAAEAVALAECIAAFKPIVVKTTNRMTYSSGRVMPENVPVLTIESRAAVGRVLDHLRALYLGGTA